MPLTGERKREYMREYCQRPEVKERKREYNRGYYTAYNQRPEVRKRKQAYMKGYWQRPEVKAQRRVTVPKEQNDKALLLWLNDGFAPLTRNIDKEPVFV